jgi:predicted nucleic acid-binding protein
LPEIICNTSPIQYLYQLGLLNVIRTLVGQLIVPPAVVTELAEGTSQGMDLPDPEELDWVRVLSPVSSSAA